MITSNNDTIMLDRTRSISLSDGLDLYEEAIKEAFARVPPSVAILDTLEIIHPKIIDEAGKQGSIRIVHNTEGINAALEPTAPLNPGQFVFWTACPFEVKLQDISEISMPVLTIEIDNSQNILIPYFEEAISDTSSVRIIYRPYLSTDFTKPQIKKPIQFMLKSIEISVASVQMVASYMDLVNKKFLKALYLPDRFPGLKRE